MAQGIKSSNGHNAVPVVTLHHNPHVRTSDDPTAGKVRGKTLLPADREHPAGYQTRNAPPMGKC